MSKIVQLPPNAPDAPDSAEAPGSAANQGIERSAAVLRVLARLHESGARLTDVAVETGLSKSTVHRLLAGLIQVGFVEQDTANGRFFLSFEMFNLGSAAANRFGIVELAYASMLRLSTRTEDTVTLQVRSGNDAICAHREMGAFPIKVLTLAVGDRRPLGVGSGPLSLLAFLPDKEVEAVIEANAARLGSYPAYSAPYLFEQVEQTRQRGYAFNAGTIVPEIFAVGVPIRGRDARPVASLSIATIAGRMQESRRANIAQWMLAEARALEERIANLTKGLNESGLRRFKGLT